MFHARLFGQQSGYRESKEDFMARPNRGNIRRTQSGKGKGSNAPRFPEGVVDGVMVNGYSAEWLSKGFDWVYSVEVVDRKGQTKSGSVVEIVS